MHKYDPKINGSVQRGYLIKLRQNSQFLKLAATFTLAGLISMPDRIRAQTTDRYAVFVADQDSEDARLFRAVHCFSARQVRVLSI